MNKKAVSHLWPALPVFPPRAFRLPAFPLRAFRLPVFRPLALVPPVLRLSAFLLPALMLAAGCASPRIHRLGNAEFHPRSNGAPVSVVEGALDRAYEPVASLDSNLYPAGDEACRTRMTEDLKQLAGKVGADAVHKIRVLQVQTHGAMRDERVPIPGAWTQGLTSKYFMRGEAVRYIEDASPVPPSAPLSVPPSAPPDSPSETKDDGKPSQSQPEPAQPEPAQEGAKQP